MRAIAACAALAACGAFLVFMPLVLPGCSDRSVAAPPPALDPSDSIRLAARGVAALGRLEPRDGVIHIYGPAREVSVVQSLLVKPGQVVEYGGLIATLDGRAEAGAQVDGMRATYQEARAAHLRALKKFRASQVTRTRLAMFETDLKVARARLWEAEARLKRTEVHSPFRGRVLEVHAYSGERVGEGGILELGRVTDMLAIAEVYETDVSRVALGQIARITSPALDAPLFGTVERISTKVGTAAVRGSSAVGAAGERVVEVEIAIEDDQRASEFTHLQVEIEIGGDA